MFGVALVMFASSYVIRTNITNIFPDSLGILEGFLSSLIFVVLDSMTFYGGALAIIGGIMIVFTLTYKILNR